MKNRPNLRRILLLAANPGMSRTAREKILVDDENEFVKFVQASMSDTSPENCLMVTNNLMKKTLLHVLDTVTHPHVDAVGFLSEVQKMSNHTLASYRTPGKTEMLVLDFPVKNQPSIEIIVSRIHNAFADTPDDDTRHFLVNTLARWTYIVLNEIETAVCIASSGFNDTLRRLRSLDVLCEVAQNIRWVKPKK